MAYAQFLDSRRSSAEGLDSVIARRYETVSASKRLEDRYLSVGDAETCTLRIPKGEFDLMRGVGRMLKTHDGHLRILDIGAGACRPLIELKSTYGEDVEIVAVTAHDIWGEGSTALDPRYSGVDLRIENADIWSNVVKPDEVFDLIISKQGIAWLVDPLGAVERSLSQLNPGGLFLAEPTEIATQPQETRAIIHALQQHGFDPGSGWRVRAGNYQALGNFLYIHARDNELGVPLFDDLEYDTDAWGYRFVSHDPNHAKKSSVGYRVRTSTDL